MPALRRSAAQHGGILLKFMLLLVALFAAAALAWMVLLPYAVAAQLRTRTGFDVTMQALMVNPFTGEIRARGLVVNNPPTFPRPEFLQIREFTAEADLLTFFSTKPVIGNLSLDVGLVALVKRADGRTNMEVFRGYLADENGLPPPTVAAEAARAFLIRKLRVRFDHLLLADYTSREPIIQDYPVRLDRTFSNVADIRQLLLPDSLNQLFALGGTVGTILPEEINRVLDNVLRSGQDLLKSVPRPNTEALHGYSDALEESKKP